MDTIKKISSAKELLIHLFNSNEKLKFDEEELKNILALLLNRTICDDINLYSEILTELVEINDNLSFFNKVDLNNFKSLNNNSEALLDLQILTIVITKYLISYFSYLNDTEQTSLIEYKKWLNSVLKKINQYSSKTVFLFCKLIISQLDIKLIKSNHYSILLRKSRDSIFFNLILTNSLFPLVPPNKKKHNNLVPKIEIVKQINISKHPKLILFFDITALEFRKNFSHILLNILNEDVENKYIFCFHIRNYSKNCENIISHTFAKYKYIKPQILVISHAFSNNTQIDKLNIYYELMKEYDLPILHLENNIFIEGQKIRDGIQSLIMKHVNLATTSSLNTINKDVNKPTQFIFFNNTKASAKFLITLKKLCSKFSYRDRKQNFDALYNFLIVYSYRSLKKFYKDTLSCKDFADYISIENTKSQLLEENITSWIKIYDHSFYTHTLPLQAGKLNKIHIKLHILDKHIDTSKPQVICLIESDSCDPNKLAEQLDLEYSPSLKAPFIYLYQNKEIYELNIPTGINALNLQLKVWNFNNKNIFVSFNP